jgi:hypothetical protein
MGTKIIKSQAVSDAGVVVADNSVRMTVKEDNGVVVAENGTTINGPISIVSNPSQVRIGGLWTFNNPFQMMIPSTYATPAPVLMVDPPVKQLTSIMEDAAVMLGLLGIISAL